jgi:hypothetical protein
MYGNLESKKACFFFPVKVKVSRTPNDTLMLPKNESRNEFRVKKKPRVDPDFIDKSRLAQFVGVGPKNLKYSETLEHESYSSTAKTR